MSSKQDNIAKLAHIGGLTELEIDLAETALLLSALDKPDRELTPYRAHLADLAAAAKATTGTHDFLDGRVAAINRLMFESHGYCGDIETYDEPENANLLDVIDRRAGLPVSIGIIYMHAARAAGCDISGLAFPGADAELNPRHHAPVNDRDILLRLQNNIKSRALNAGETERAGEILERMALIAPNVASVWRELGLLSMHLGNLRRAVNAFETFLNFAPPTAQEREAESLLEQIKSSLN